MEPRTKKPENADRTVSLVLYAGFGLVVIFAGIWFRESLVSGLYSLESTLEQMDYWGPVLLTVIASLWAVLCLPGPIILGFIGTAYSSHPILGLIIAVTADSVAEVVGFLVARHLGRDMVTDWLEDKPWFQWLEEQAEERGAYGVFVIRMMPFFPNSLANYALGLSALRFWPYLIASILGSIPNLAVYIFGTAGAIRLLRTGLGQNSLEIAAAIIFATVVVLIVLQNFLRKHGRLAEVTEESTEQ